MSVTILDVLKLSSMKGAEVLTKRSNLGQVVTSVTVLEYSETNETQKWLKNNIHFRGNEIVLTSFSSIKNDVEAQCRNLKYQAELGEVAIVLFYVGIVMPKVDRKLIEMADKLGLVIVCMPRNDPTLAYSDVITEILNSIFNDQVQHPNLVVEILKNVSSMPDKRQSIDSVIQIISNRLKISLAILDQKMILLHESSWPRSKKIDWLHFISVDGSIKTKARNGLYRRGYDLLFRRLSLKNNTQFFNLFIMEETGKLGDLQHQQIIQIIEIVLKIWQENQTYIGRSGLIENLMQGRMIKAEQIAKRLELNLSNFKNMWIIKNIRYDDKKQLYVVREISKMFSRDIICEYYHNNIIILYSKKIIFDDLMLWGQQLVECFSQNNRIETNISYFKSVANVSQLNKMFTLTDEVNEDVRIIFPQKIIFNVYELLFVQRCRKVIEEEKIEEVDRILKPLESKEELIDTLSVFLLDTQVNIIKTADLEFVHRNTIKYRLRRINNLLGFSISNPIMLGRITLAVAVRRLINNGL